MHSYASRESTRKPTEGIGSFNMDSRCFCPFGIAFGINPPEKRGRCKELQHGEVVCQYIVYKFGYDPTKTQKFTWICKDLLKAIGYF